jgi:hypothetical protein
MQTPIKTDGRKPGALNHPSSEEWMSYLYGEGPRQAKAALNAHLRACTECQQRVAAWRITTSNLDHWRVATPEAAFGWDLGQPALKWAWAALLVLGLGYGIGRFSTPSANPEEIRSAIEKPLRAALVADIKQQVQDELRSDWQAILSGNPEVLNTDFRRQLRAELDLWSAKTLADSTTENQRFLADFADTYSAYRQQDQQATLTLFNQAEQKRRADYVNLRRALETVAVVAADKFQRTETQLGQLASYAQASSVAEPMDPTP